MLQINGLSPTFYAGDVWAREDIKRILPQVSVHLRHTHNMLGMKIFAGALRKKQYLGRFRVLRRKDKPTFYHLIFPKLKNKTQKAY